MKNKSNNISKHDVAKTVWYLGTIGFAYKAWQGLFYPPWLETRNYLATYSKIFNAVEVDSTFYGIPRLETVARWRDQISPDFRLCPKTPRSITHDFSLQTSLNEMQRFIEVISTLEQNLGPILLQWPPHFSTSHLDDLDNFLAALPNGIQTANEFRHPSWDTNQTADLLTKHQAAWVSVDYVHSPRKIIPTTDFLFIRWLGEHDRFIRGSEDRLDVSRDLDWWQAEIDKKIPETTTVYGFFNDDFAGHGPETCNQFKALIGLPTQYPQFPKQGTLF
ncbi:MAG: DUF72 domain-containing protein [Chloroflexota bacterium]